MSQFEKFYYCLVYLPKNFHKDCFRILHTTNNAHSSEYIENYFYFFQFYKNISNFLDSFETIRKFSLRKVKSHIVIKKNNLLIFYLSNLSKKLGLVPLSFEHVPISFPVSTESRHKFCHNDNIIIIVVIVKLHANKKIRTLFDVSKRAHRLQLHASRTTIFSGKILPFPLYISTGWAHAQINKDRANKKKFEQNTHTYAKTHSPIYPHAL